VNKKTWFWALVALIALAVTGCSTNINSGQASGDKPQPQVRVEAMPSATPTLPGMVDNVAPTPEPSASPTAAWMYYDPTPDEDVIANQIQSMMDDIDKRLNSTKFIFNK